MSQPSLDLEFEDPSQPTYGVGELAAVIGQTLRRRFGDGVWVRGEIEGLRTDRNGHTWFALCERSEHASASLAVVLFGGTAARLRPLLRRHRLRLADGMRVRIFVEVDVHAPSGRLTLKMNGLDPAYTLGQLAADRDQLLAALAGDDLLQAQRRLPLPACPFRVGLVTSRGSAAWHDLVGELRRSGYRWQLVVCDTAVQGVGAETAVAAGLRRMASAGVDIVALVRGGGSRTDLATFDAEPVARAIAGLRVPVVTGLGHEIDRAVADEVACLALKTPTAVGAWLVEQARAYHDAAEAAWAAIARHSGGHLRRDHQRLTAAARRLADRTHAVVGRADERLEAHGRHLARSAGRVVTTATARLERAGGRIEGSRRRHLSDASRHVDRLAGSVGQRAPRALVAPERQVTALAGRAAALEPARALARGWSITRTADGRLARTAADLRPGEVLVTTLAQGHVRSRVKHPEPVDGETAAGAQP